MPTSGEITLSRDEVAFAIEEYLQKYKLRPSWADNYDMALLYYDGYQRTSVGEITVKFVKSSKR